jgi:signal transduction histidine kinase
VGEALPVICAPAEINQVVLNLLVNAMQAIEATGRVAGLIKIETLARGDEVILEVADDGCGIPVEILPRIFDPFFTTKEVGRGTGLGLAITYGIVQDHGGTITADNARDGGAVFHIELPSAHESVGDRVSADSPPG